MTDEERAFKAILSALPLTLEGKADPGVIEFKNWNVEEAVRKIAEAFAAIRRDQIEKDARIANGWARSKSCTSHDNNPCCHVRTGIAIREAIRSHLADKGEVK